MSEFELRNARYDAVFVPVGLTAGRGTSQETHPASQTTAGRLGSASCSKPAVVLS